MTTYAQDSIYITPTQLKQSNLVFIERDYLEQKDSLNVIELKAYKQLVQHLNKSDSICHEELQNCASENQFLYDEIDNLSIKINKTRNFALGSTITAGCLLLLLILL